MIRPIMDFMQTIKCRARSTMNSHKGNNKKFIKHRVLFFVNFNLVKNDQYKIIKKIPEKITKNIFVESNTYDEFEVPESHTNNVTNTNGHLFKSTVPIVSYLI